ncbi:MAG: hypothetical protein ACRBDX_11480 [Gammaproteobacteria bacterium]
MLKLILKKLFKISLLALIVISFLALGNLYTYKRLTAEKPIAQLTFTLVSNQVFDASLSIGDACKVNTYRIYGDEWRIDSQFLKWKSWANLFGLNAMYRIDRLSGRYVDIKDENSKLHSAHDLKVNSTLDLSKLAERYDNTFPPVDTVYGSSVYEKMQEKILYTVFLTQSGILIRESELTTGGNGSCVEDESKWKSTIVMLDQKLASFIKSIK